MEDQKSAIDKKSNKLIAFLAKEHFALGKSRVRHSHAWIVLCLVVSFAFGIVIIASRELYLEVAWAVAEETPWQSHAYGTLYTDKNWNNAMGYHFIPLVNGQVTALGGFFNGTKTVKLFNHSTGTLLASATVNAANTWGYTAITPVSLSANTKYTVAVYSAGSGASYRGSLSPILPQTYGSIKITGSTYASTFSNPTARPTNTISNTMYGQADIKFVASSSVIQPPTPPPPDGGSTASLSYPYTKGYLTFPKDEGSHPNNNVEWWYTNFNVKDSNQKNFRGFIALTRLNFTNTKSGLLIIGLTDVNNNIFWSKIYQGNITALQNKMDLSFVDDASTMTVIWKQTTQPFNYNLIVNSPEIKTNLIMKSQKLPLVEGGKGLVPIASGIDSYYYSLTKTTATASSITLNLSGNPSTYTGINGSAWLDHQWFSVPLAVVSSQTLKPQHEWFSAQLSNGTELIFWKILSNGITYSYLGFMRSDGSQIDTTTFNLSPLSYWTASDGKKYANSWRLTSTAHGINLTIKTQTANQQVRGTVKINGQNIDSTFYEGGTLVNGIFGGKSVTGSGYAELSKTY